MNNLGSFGEKNALIFLQQQDLVLVSKNYRCNAGEIDLIMRHKSSTEMNLIFVEVRARANLAFGGAAVSVTKHKQQCILKAAKHYLQRYCKDLAHNIQCRFDVIAFENGELFWYLDAF